MFKVMVYHFRITSPESRNFHLEVEMDGEHNFFDFHNLIQKSIGYESHQLASFFLYDQHGKKSKEISLLDTGFNGGAYLIMQKTNLATELGLNTQSLYYTYDFISDRSLNIELTGIFMERNLKEPTVILKRGDAPVQVYEEDSYVPDSANFHEEEVLMDFGILDDYTELYGEMEDF
jgi:predicted aspartyl protease